MAISITVDFADEDLTYEQDNADELLQAWLAGNAPAGVTGRVVRLNGPGGGWPEVELTAPDQPSMDATLLAYGGPGMLEDYGAEA
jgi:hypothetical protein